MNATQARAISLKVDLEQQQAFVQENKAVLEQAIVAIDYAIEMSAKDGIYSIGFHLKKDNPEHPSSASGGTRAVYVYISNLQRASRFFKEHYENLGFHYNDNSFDYIDFSWN